MDLETIIYGAYIVESVLLAVLIPVTAICRNAIKLKLRRVLLARKGYSEIVEITENKQMNSHIVKFGKHAKADGKSWNVRTDRMVQHEGMPAMIVNAKSCEPLNVTSMGSDDPELLDPAIFDQIIDGSFMNGQLTQKKEDSSLKMLLYAILFLGLVNVLIGWYAAGGL